MNNDVVPSLIEKVFNSFNEGVENNTQIKAFYAAIDKKKANMQDVQKYAKTLGKIGANAILKHLTKDNLPNGVLYWNIAERIISPLFEEIQKLVFKNYAIVQEYTDQKKGINLKPIEAPFQSGRIRDFIDTLVRAFNEEDGE